jgi:hypothetical protein
LVRALERGLRALNYCSLQVPTAALAGVGCYGIVFHTKITRSGHRRWLASDIFNSHRLLHSIIGIHGHKTPKGLRVQITIEALADLERLFDFLAEHNPKLARERMLSVR